THELGHVAALLVGDRLLEQYDQRQAFRLQGTQHLHGLVGAAVVENDELVKMCAVVPDEGLDDIDLVPHATYGNELHFCETPWRTSIAPSLDKCDWRQKSSRKRLKAGSACSRNSACRSSLGGCRAASLAASSSWVSTKATPGQDCSHVS